MNDYRYHYMFTTFVSLADIVVRIGIFCINLCTPWLFILTNYLPIFTPLLFRPYAMNALSTPTFRLHKDIESFDLEDFKYNSVNITAFRLVDVNSKRVTEIMDQVKKVQKNSGREDLVNVSSIMEVL